MLVRIIGKRFKVHYAFQLDILENENLKKGLIFGTLAIFFIGIQPIAANVRPSYIDAYIFGAMNAIVQSFIFLPIFVMERKWLKKSIENDIKNVNIYDSRLNGWKKKENIRALILIGLIFSIVPPILFVGLEFAGVVNGALALKSEIIFSLLYGFLFLKERVTKTQILFSFVLLFGLILAVTQGSFNLLEFNIGVIILIMDVGLYMVGHTLAKSRFDNNELTPYQVGLVRNVISGTILFSTYFIFFPLENVEILMNPANYFYFIFMGVTYGFGLLAWFKTLSYMKIGKGVILMSFSVFITAIFGVLIFAEVLSIFQFFGMIIVIISLVIIIREKKE